MPGQRLTLQQSSSRRVEDIPRWLLGWDSGRKTEMSWEHEHIKKCCSIVVGVTGLISMAWTRWVGAGNRCAICRKSWAVLPFSLRKGCEITRKINFLNVLPRHIAMQYWLRIKLCAILSGFVPFGLLRRGIENCYCSKVTFLVDVKK